MSIERMSKSSGIVLNNTAPNNQLSWIEWPKVAVQEINLMYWPSAASLGKGLYPSNMPCQNGLRG